jgi:hypothetical protein
MDPRYISSELLQKVPSTAVCGQVGDDSTGINKGTIDVITNGEKAVGEDGE